MGFFSSSLVAGDTVY